MFHESFFSTLNYLRTLYGDDVEMAQVIYDGEHESASPIGGFANYRHILDKI